MRIVRVGVKVQDMACTKDSQGSGSSCDERVAIVSPNEVKPERGEVHSLNLSLNLDLHEAGGLCRRPADCIQVIELSMRSAVAHQRTTRCDCAECLIQD